MRRSKALLVLAVLATAAGLGVPTAAAAPQSTSDTIAGGALAGRRLVELSETTRLADRRALVTGDRVISMGDETGLYPATGWHIRGEMGGFWSQPIKLLDGVWFAADGTWLTASRFTEHPGYTTMTLTGPGGMDIQRTDVVPDGSRAALIGLRFPPGAEFGACGFDQMSCSRDHRG